MTVEEAETLQPGVTRIRHCDGPEGIYVGRMTRGKPALVVDDGDVRARTWYLDDCEVVR